MENLKYLYYSLFCVLLCACTKEESGKWHCSAIVNGELVENVYEEHDITSVNFTLSACSFSYVTDCKCEKR